MSKKTISKKQLQTLIKEMVKEQMRWGKRNRDGTGWYQKSDGRWKEWDEPEPSAQELEAIRFKDMVNRFNRLMNQANRAAGKDFETLKSAFPEKYQDSADIQELFKAVVKNEDEKSLEIAIKALS